MPAVEKLRACSMQPGVEMLLFKFRRKIVDGKPQFVSRGPQNPTTTGKSSGGKGLTLVDALFKGGVSGA